MNMLVAKPPVEVRNCLWLALLAMLEAAQLVIWAGLLLHFMPPESPLSSTVFAEWQYLLKPEWESLLYRLFILSGAGIMGILLWRMGGRIGQEGLFKSWRFYFVGEAIWVFLLLSALFKVMVYAGRPRLAEYALAAALAASIMFKIFFPEVRRNVLRLTGYLMRPQLSAPLRRWLFVLFALLIVLIIDIPSIKPVLARMFVGEQFHHNDSFVFGPVWAYVSGCLPNVDVITQYGFGVPIVIANAAKFLGGINYEAILKVMVWGTIAYYLLWFWLLRRWLSSVLLAAAALLWGIKIQMFNQGVYPFIFTYGSATVMRYWFDVIFFILIYRHLRTHGKVALALAGVVCGVQLFYLTSEGVYLTAAYLAYLLLHLLSSDYRKYLFASVQDIPRLLLLALLPALTAFGLLWSVVGRHALEPAFWQNMGEFIQYFLSGFGVTPIYSGLQDRKFLASLMGFVVPSVYVLTVLVIGTLWYFKKVRYDRLFALILSLYGLGIYNYYVARSAFNSYYVVALPFAFLLAFWAGLLVQKLPLRSKYFCYVLLLVLSAYSLATNHLFLAYPNRLNFSRNPMVDPLVAQPLEGGRPYFNHLFRDYPEAYKVARNSLGRGDEEFKSESDFKSDQELVGYFHRESDFSLDAALIDRLVPPQEPAALISSFEVWILVQANRKPFFYYFPLVISHPMTARNLVRSSIYTTDQWDKTLRKLESARPTYVFMERIFLTRPVPDYFYTEYSSFMLLTNYVLAFYTPVEEGKYLVALKRKAQPQ